MIVTIFPDSDDDVLAAEGTGLKARLPSGSMVLAGNVELLQIVISRETKRIDAVSVATTVGSQFDFFAETVAIPRHVVFRQERIPATTVRVDRTQKLRRAG